VNSYTLLRSPLEDSLRQLFARCEQNLFIASPFISEYGVNTLTDTLADRADDITIEILTCISVSHLESGSLDLDALVHLWQMQPRLRVWSLPQLHAKVYVVDNAEAIITSSNFTLGGLQRNYEYGIALADRAVVTGISDDMRAYANLGSDFTQSEVEQLAGEAHVLQDSRREMERTERRSTAGRRYHAQQNRVQDTLLGARVKERPITAIFADTIRYLLRSGPMTTQQLHSRIKEIHPDICDDNMDRVINGQHFGKLWKHHVRNAQQTLKGRGEIVLHGTHWQLTNLEPE
jgi:hypothetical protein